MKKNHRFTVISIVFLIFTLVGCNSGVQNAALPTETSATSSTASTTVQQETSETQNETSNTQQVTTETQQKNSETQQATQASSAEKSESGVTYPLEGNPTITITRSADTDLPTAGFTSYNDTANTRYWSEATGINIKYIEPADGTALLLNFASGSVSEVVICGMTFYPGGVGAMVSDGLATDLTELLPEYAPDYWNFVNSFSQYLKVAREIDGKFYNINGYFYEEGSFARFWFGLVARKEYLDQLGIGPPTTIDELYSYLFRLKNELGVETPFMSDKSRFDSMFSGDGCLSSAFGFATAGRYHIGDQVYFGAYQHEYKELLAWLNKLYIEGLLDVNFAVTDEPTANAAMLSGNSGLMVTASSRLSNMMLAADSEDFNLLGLSPLKQPDGSKALFSFADPYVSGGHVGFITAKATQEQTINALKMFNYLYTDEGKIMSNFGREGETFDYVNGKPILNKFITENQDGIPKDGQLRVNCMLNFPIIFLPEMTEQRFSMPAMRAALDAWAVSDSDLYKIQNSSIAPEFAEEYASLWTDIDTYIKESRAKFISGELPIDSFETVYIPTLEEMGIKRVMEIYQSSYELYNK